MAALSKLATVEYSCYELGHTWTPFCTTASRDVAISVGAQSFVIYGTLFLVAGLLRKRGKDYFKKKVWLEILQSTTFLTTNATLFMTGFCLWRKLAGFYFYLNAFVCGIPASALSLCIERKERKMLRGYSTLTTAFLPGFIASFVAIFVERKSRRGILAVYMGNVAIETLWYMLKTRGLVKSIPNGEVLLFSVAVAIYMYLFKKRDGLPESTSSLFKKFLGGEEMPYVEENGQLLTNQETRSSKQLQQHPVSLMFTKAVDWLKGCPSHHLCRHHDSCAFYVIKASLKMFGAGYGLQSALKLAGSLRRIFKHPELLQQSLVSWNNAKLGLFLGGFIGIFRAVNCLLRWVRNRDDSIHGLLSGFLAGWSVWFYKGPTLPLYTASKLAELLYFKGITAGYLPYIRCADTIIYSLSTALVFHAAVIEPHSLRPAYWRFLLKITGNKFAEMNRKLLDEKIPGCSQMFPDYWPNYDPKYTNLARR